MRIIVLVRMECSSLPQEEVAGRVVRPVNLRVALRAAASHDPVAPRVHLRLVVDRRRVAARHVAALAEHRLLGDVHPLVVRAGPLAHGAGGPAALRGPVDQAPRRATLRGVEAAKRIRNGWLDAWAEHHLEIDEILDAGDDLVVIVHLEGRGRGSGAEVDVRLYLHMKVRDGRVVYVFEHEDRAEALEAVGLEE